VEYRRLVCHDDGYFEVPEGGLAFQHVPAQHYRRVFEFGCGCGRIARQLMGRSPSPESYIGIDIHRGMIQWCRDNLTPVNPAFEFLHHDVWHPSMGADNTRQSTAPFPGGDQCFSLVIAHSVFTHLFSNQAEFYLSEISRILALDGTAQTTWFFFDRQTFPMMFEFQNCLFINENDPTNAVIYDWQWFLRTVRNAGLCVESVTPPALRGFQWEVVLRKRSGDSADRFPTDLKSLQQMSGSGAGSAETAEASAIQAVPVSPRHRLKFTGSAGPDEFKSKCSQLDWWYHSYYFDNGFEVKGDYDVGADVASYGFPVSMSGMRVLDIGTGAGWFAHYFEQLGAEVYTVDARGYEDFDVYGREDYPGLDPNRAPDRFDENGRAVYDSSVSKGFWVMKELLGSKVRFRNARVYDVQPELFGGERFDLVFLGAILCHLRDPIGALMAARRVCRHKLIASTPVIIGEREDEAKPRQYLPYTDIDRISWWVPNEACFRQWFLAAGFQNVDIRRQAQLRCDVTRTEGGRVVNGDQSLRVAHAYVY
jgi:SAM-dependent methyltransferase